LLLNAAILLLPYKDPANPEIITQLYKLMLYKVKVHAQRQDADEQGGHGGHQERGGGAVLGRPDGGVLLGVQAIRPART
jgi:hypothetical protein